MIKLNTFIMGRLIACGILAVLALLRPGILMAEDKPVAAPGAAAVDPIPATGPEADVLRTLPHYKPLTTVSGTIRLWTRPPKFFGDLMKAWQDGFSKFHPDIKYDFKTYGTASVVPAVTEGVADIAVLGEEIYPGSAAAFEKTRHYPPTAIEIATGSLNIRNMSPAQVFFVHKDNPISKLTLAQLDGILGSEHRRGLTNIRTWGQLGLTGEWADKPIHPYTWYLAESFCLYFQHAILEDSHQWSSAITEFVSTNHPDGTPYVDGEQILDALSNDRYGIGVSSFLFVRPQNQVKALALAANEGEPYYEATKENLIERRYPLTRLIPAVIDRAPGQPIDPKVKEFLRYILSQEGQSDIVRSHCYLPLNKDALEEQLKKLE